MSVLPSTGNQMRRCRQSEPSTPYRCHRRKQPVAMACRSNLTRSKLQLFPACWGSKTPHRLPSARSVPDASGAKALDCPSPIVTCTKAVRRSCGQENTSSSGRRQRAVFWATEMQEIFCRQPPTGVRGKQKKQAAEAAALVGHRGLRVPDPARSALPRHLGAKSSSRAAAHAAVRRHCCTRAVPRSAGARTSASPSRLSGDAPCSRHSGVDPTQLHIPRPARPAPLFSRSASDPVTAALQSCRARSGALHWGLAVVLGRGSLSKRSCCSCKVLRSSSTCPPRAATLNASRQSATEDLQGSSSTSSAGVAAAWAQACFIASLLFRSACERLHQQVTPTLSPTSTRESPH